MSENASFSFGAISVPAGPLLRGALPRRASLQPRGQRRGGGGERPDRLRLQARFCGGSTTGRTTSRRVDHVFTLLRAACVILSPSLFTQNGQKKTDPGSLEDLSRDETDRAVPLSEPITIQRRSPLIRNHKTGSMEVMRTDLI